jgi:hypothetical protein
MSAYYEGYIAGWQSARPGTNPPGVPAFSLPAGREEYKYGFEQGRAKAERENGSDKA